MFAVYFARHGGPEVLTAGEIPDPHVGRDEVVVEVKAASVNHLDLFVRRGIPGLELTLPHVPGSDAAGVVVEVGSEVTTVRVGDRVVVDPGVSCGACSFCRDGEPSLCPRYRIMGEHFQGSYAQFVKVPAAGAVPMPAGLTFAEAASLPLTLLTAWRMLIRRGRVAPGEDVLILGAGSGVGVMAVQLARLAGARVFATASTPEKRARAKEIGADIVLDPGAEPVERAIRKLTGKRGVDVVVDYVGRDTWVSSLKCLRNGGRLLTCGATTGHDPTEDLRHIFYRQLVVIGSTMGSRNDLEAGLKAVEQGKVKPVVFAELPLTEAAEAHRLLETRKVFGKVVLVP